MEDTPGEPCTTTRRKKKHDSEPIELKMDRKHSGIFIGL
jgi:hypothetical protein